MKLVIERAKWCRGGDHDTALIRTRDGKMCCLGFYGLACGIHKEELFDVRTPIYVKTERWPVSCLEHRDSTGDHDGIDRWIETKWTNEAIHINDARMKEDERESDIIAHFAKVGVEVEFV